jgi:hypothetical protein
LSLIIKARDNQHTAGQVLNRADDRYREAAKTQKETASDYATTPPAKPPVPGTSSSSSVSFGGNKPEFKTIYTRPR